MEGHVNVDFFQTQLKYVLHILVDVAVTEITHIFQCTVGSDTGRPSIRNNEVLECTLKSALEGMRNLRMNPNEKSTNYNRAWYLGVQSDCTASTPKRNDSNILLKNEREDALWERTGSTQDSSLLRGNTEQLDLVSRNEKARLTPITRTTSPLDQPKEDDPTTTSPAEQSNTPEVPAPASVGQEPTQGLRIVSVFTSPFEDPLKVEDLDWIAASTPRKPSSHPAPSNRQETRDDPLIPPLRKAPTRSRLARLPDFSGVLEAKVSEPSDVKERLDAVRLPESSKNGEDTMKDFVLTLNSSSSTASSPTLPFPSPTSTSPTPPSPSPTSPTLPSPSITSPPPPPAKSSTPTRHKACTVRLVDIRKALAPLSLAPLSLTPLSSLPPRRFACRDCGKLFERRRDIRRHRRFHTGEKPYGCGLCRRLYTLKSNLRLHLKEAHAGGEPHLCEFCGKQFTYLSKLSSHLRFHTGEKPYDCTFCGKRFRLRKNLRDHVCEHFKD